jgi:hypothetical protein
LDFITASGTNLQLLPFSTTNTHQNDIQLLDIKVETDSDNIELQKEKERGNCEGLHQVAQLSLCVGQ